MSFPWLGWPLRQKTDIIRRLEDTDFEEVGTATGEMHPEARIVALEVGREEETPCFFPGSPKKLTSPEPC